MHDTTNDEWMQDLQTDQIDRKQTNPFLKSNVMRQQRILTWMREETKINDITKVLGGTCTAARMTGNR